MLWEHKGGAPPDGKGVGERFLEEMPGLRQVRKFAGKVGRKGILCMGCRSLGYEESTVSWGNYKSYTD